MHIWFYKSLFVNLFEIETKLHLNIYKIYNIQYTFTTFGLIILFYPNAFYDLYM